METDDVSTSLTEAQPMEIEITRELPPIDLPPVTFENIRDRLKQSYVLLGFWFFFFKKFLFSLKSVTDLNSKHKIEHEKLQDTYEISQQSLQKNTVDYPKMEKEYQFYQKYRAYLYSFVECYNEKVCCSSKRSFSYSTKISSR